MFYTRVTYLSFEPGCRFCCELVPEEVGLGEGGLRLLRLLVQLLPQQLQLVVGAERRPCAGQPALVRRLQRIRQRRTVRLATALSNPKCN